MTKAINVVSWIAAVGLVGATAARVLDLIFSSGVVRWLRWTIRCRRGARCAHLVTARLDAPPGAVVRMTYRCDGCGTHYLGEAMALGDGSWSETSRERVTT